MKSINRIFLLGDSWIEGQGTYSEIGDDDRPTEPNLPFGPRLKNGINQWRKENSWNKFFRDRYGKDITICNLGMQGSDNYQQFMFLNFILKHDYCENDLILFGFTSKYRDNRAISYIYNTSTHEDWKGYCNIEDSRNKETSLLSNSNPISSSPLSFEQAQIALQKLEKNNDDNLFMGKESFFDDETISDAEKDFSKKWIEDYFVELFDEKTHENIAATNYMFYQKYSKWKGINILFFDLFEPYVNPKSVNEFYEVDESIYINYNKKTCRDMLVDYEFENYNTASLYTIWEENMRFPCLSSSENLKGNKKDRYSGPIYHPNQHGYKVLFDYIADNFIDKKYKIENLI